MIVVRRTYTPKPGCGSGLLQLVRAAADAMADAGFEKPVTFRTHSGYHGAVITEQAWENIAAYEASRGQVRRTAAITAIFEQIYALLASTHHTEILERVE